MEIIRAPCGSTPTEQPGYSGVVWVDREVVGVEGSRLLTFGAQFGPAARTAWHRGAYGRILRVAHGTGRVQRLGGPVREVHAGDAIIVAAGEWHWHGATAENFMCHLALWESPGAGEPETEWGDLLTDGEYPAPVE